MATRARLLIISLTLSLGGCGASLDSLSTGSLFGGSSKTAAPAAAPQIPNDPTTRAMQVGTTSARALKCGFNFDPVKLRTQFLANEAGALGNAQDVAKIEKVYDVSFNGISKAVAGQGASYCSAHKTAEIKSALNRHLAGDYTPELPKAEPEPEEEGLFGGSSASNDSNGIKYRIPGDNRE